MGSDSPDRRADGTPSATTTIVVMGVAGVGKSTVMEALADRLGWTATEGDAFHSARNIAKMRAGLPLDDEDRRPWLAAIASWIDAREAAGENAIVTCSALKRAYRDLLRRDRPSVWFADLVAPEAAIVPRIRRRVGHYMPVSLLRSQFETLEPLEPDEPGVEVAADRPVDEVVDEIVRRLPRRP